MTVENIIRNTVTVIAIAWSSLCASDSLFDLEIKCVSLEHVIAFAEDIDTSGGSPTSSTIAEYAVQDPGSHHGKAGNAYRKLQIVKKFFVQEAGWTSVDNKSTPIFLLSNLTSDIDSDSCSGMNASFFSPKQGIILMLIYLGHEDSREDLANDIDIIGHEFGHGIFAEIHPYASNGSPELGGINEGVSDMLGVTVRAWYQAGQNLNQTVVRTDSFLVGQTFAQIDSEYYEGVHTTMAGALRNNLNPVADGRTKDYYDYLGYSQHENSGIVSLPYALLVKGGRHPRFQDGPEVQGIGFEKAFRILFYVLNHRIPFVNMPEFAAAMQRAAGRLYGQNSMEWRSTTNAFAATGLIAAADQSRPEPQPETQSEPENIPDSVPQETDPVEAEPISTPLPGNGSNYLSGPTVMMILFIALSSLIGIAVLLVRRRRVEIDRMIDERSAVQSEIVLQADSPAKSEAPTDKIQDTIPTHVLENESLAITLVTSQMSFPAKLDETPLVIGREPALGLPEKFRKQLELDSKISRQHMEIWYQYLYRKVNIRCKSQNGMFVSGQYLQPYERVEADTDSPLDLILGDTQIKLLFRI